ncbi:hypothetical protein LG293_17040 (plasmid) [Citricoccus nitrophenolicus]
MDNITGTQDTRVGQHLTLVILDADRKFLTLFSGAQFLTAHPRLHAAAAEDAAAGRNFLTKLTEALPATDWSIAKILSQLERHRSVDPKGAVLALGEATGNDRETFNGWDVWGTAELTEWLDANPAWVSECGRPHPFGGYHGVSQESAGDERCTFYRDDDGNLHRTDGPAAIMVDEKARLRTESWHQHGLNITPGHQGDEYDDDRWPDDLQPWQFSRTVSVEHGEVEVGAGFTDREGELHRDGGPAVLARDGGRQWWHHGQLVLIQSGSKMETPFMVTTDGELVPDPSDTEPRAAAG